MSDRPDQPAPAPLVLVVMGVAGSGKTTVAHLLADAMGCPFQEGDELHSEANVAKMRAGTPLTDEDRWPWLHTIAGVIDDWLERGSSGVVTCSALKRRYRDLIIGDRAGVRLVYLAGSTDLLSPRLAMRQGHYMPAALLDSQFDALEIPAPDENPITIPVDRTPAALADAILAAIGRG